MRVRVMSLRISEPMPPSADGAPHTSPMERAFGPPRINLPAYLGRRGVPFLTDGLGLQPSNATAGRTYCVRSLCSPDGRAHP
jgi:hypothetical protein